MGQHHREVECERPLAGDGAVDEIGRDGQRAVVVRAELRDVARRRGYPLVTINALGMRDDMKAIGLFAHGGVAAHPGDAGMRAIADALLAAILPLL